MSEQHITLIKFGGAVITNKEIPESIRQDVLTRLVRELGQAHKEFGRRYVLGNGAGSFAHVPATRYKTAQGFIEPDSKIGMAITQDAAARLNRLVVHTCLEAAIPALTLAPSNSIVTDNKKVASYCADVFEQYLSKDMLPVTYGDVIADQSMGCTIWSTDTVFSFFAREFVKRGWVVDQIIHVTEAEGVWKLEDGKWLTEKRKKVIYDTITPSMRDEVHASMSDTKGFDVTGGMWHKIEEALSLTDLGITTRIISGLIPGNLYKTLAGDTTIGTKIAKV